MLYDPSNRLRFQVPTMIAFMVIGGLLAVREGNKHASATLSAVGCVAIIGGAYFTVQWSRAKAKDSRSENRKEK